MCPTNFANLETLIYEPCTWCMQGILHELSGGLHWQYDKDGVFKTTRQSLVKEVCGNKERRKDGRKNDSALLPFEACNMELGPSLKYVQATVKDVRNELGT